MTREVQQRSKVKFRIMEYEMEGGSNAIEQGLKSIASALSRQNEPKPMAQIPLKQVAPGPKAEPPPQMSIEEVIGAPQDGVEDVNERLVESEAKPAKQKHYTVPNVVTDLDLAGLKEFVALKDPKNDNDRYLVFSAWLKEQRKIEQITIDHAYTCIRLLGVRVQKDVGQPFRKLKAQGCFTQPAEGTFAITHIGLDRVAEMGTKG